MRCLSLQNLGQSKLDQQNFSSITKMAYITQDTVDKFKEMFKKEYGVEYTNEDAWKATSNLLNVFEWLIKEDRKQHPENYIRKN